MTAVRQDDSEKADDDRGGCEQMADLLRVRLLTDLVADVVVGVMAVDVDVDEDDGAVVDVVVVLFCCRCWSRSSWFEDSSCEDRFPCTPTGRQRLFDVVVVVDEEVVVVVVVLADCQYLLGEDVPADW